MLRRLKIENIALIRNESIELSDGFVVFSGETGAGKSLVIDSLALVLGARADRGLISYGEKQASVEAVFEGLSEKTTSLMFEYGIDEDDTLVVFRRIYDDGRNECRVNGRSVTVGMLKALASTLVDVYGQFENQTMFKAANQLEIVDSIAGNKGLLLDLSTKIDEIRQVDDELDQLVGDDKERERSLDMLAFQIDEIEEAGFVDGEEDQLKEKHNKIVAREKVLDSLSACLKALGENGGDEKVTDLVKAASNSLSVAGTIEEDAQKAQEVLSGIVYDLEDVVCGLESIVDSYEDSEEEIDRVEERLDLLNNFKKKYGKSIEDINEFCNKAKERFELLSNAKESADRLKAKKEKLEIEARKICESLHEKRVFVGKQFAADISEELGELGMKSAKFDVDIEFVDKISATGSDNVEFMFSANSGLPIRPLAKVASGGELSRFMLALKSVLGKHGHIGTMVFDEIDTGISGNIAKVVGEKMYKISRLGQVLCVSHLPQIACLADVNFLIEKKDDGISTLTSVVELDKTAKIAEVARLVGGSTESGHAVLHATDLVEEADKFKQSVF